MSSLPLNVPMRFDSIPLLWTQENVLSLDECCEKVRFIESSNPSLATNNPMYRDQDRIIKDIPQLAQMLFSRMESNLPKRIENFSLVRINERFRFYRYKPGQKFLPHMDHWYQPGENQISLLSIIIYLNDKFSGGETRFMEQLTATVIPRAGMAAIFQHKVRHEGCEVTQGKKYAFRTDVIYEKVSSTRSLKTSTKISVDSARF